MVRSFVMAKKNKSYASVNIPHEYNFSINPSFGLLTSPLAKEIINNQNHHV